MELGAKILTLLGTLVLIAPVVQANALAKNLTAVKGTVEGFDGPNLAALRERVTTELSDVRWTSRDQNLLVLGYGLVILAQVIQLFV